jgi:hypothetical protein
MRVSYKAHFRAVPRGVAAVIALPLVPLAYADQAVVVKVDRSIAVGVSHFSIGITLMGTGNRREHGNPQAVAKEQRLLANGFKYMNQHIMLFGAGDPEPRPGVYDWRSLDQDMAQIRSMHGVPIITLCCAPGWMNTISQDLPRRTGPYSWAVGRVTDNDVKDYAKLCKKVALRYPYVKHFQVWNEFKGYWDKATDNYDYVPYTKFYNAVYDAVKCVRPDAKIGGPYYPQPEPGGPKAKDWIAIDYWLKHKHGADFVCFDGWITGYPPPPDEEAKKMASTDYFGKIADELRARTNLPIWISEFYGGVGGFQRGRARSSNLQFIAADFASWYLHALLSGVSIALLWGTGIPGLMAPGGQPTPHYRVVKIFNSDFGPGTRLYKTTSSSPEIEFLASKTETLLINKRSANVPVRLNGHELLLTPYDVRLVNASTGGPS